MNKKRKINFKCPDFSCKLSQVSIFIIIAIIIVAITAGFFLLREKISIKKIPSNFEPVYNSFLSCLEDYTETGISVLESQGGYIYLPEFEPGSYYMPFSSYLIFLGNPIPYWYYVSGNNIKKEQVPKKEDMENQLGEFIQSKINNCNFDMYYNEGFEIERESPEAEVIILDNKVNLYLDMPLIIKKGNETFFIKEHKIVVNSNLGKLYESARKIYEQEQKELFLESFTLDILRNYAPVDGVALSCSPKIWEANRIFSDLEEAIEVNTLALRKGSGNYFSINLPIDEKVRFITSKNWPRGFEVEPSEGSLLVSRPVGNQPGLGILGFCYVPYHFVYNIKYPVLIQVYSENEEEIFQFPVAVIIQGNQPRESLNASAVGLEEPELCKYKNVPITLRIYNSNFSPVDANISYKCLGEICEIGATSSGILEENFPQCVNGYIITKADGFKDSKIQLSTLNQGTMDIILDRAYDMEVNLKLDGKEYNEEALITLISDKTETIFYPSQKNIKLSEGEYEIQVYIYKNSSLKLQESSVQECIDVSREGTGGLFGLTEKKCFDVKIPSQIISNILVGGGKGDYYILEEELKSSKILELDVESLPIPKTIEQLQNNYELFETKTLNINLI